MIQKNLPRYDDDDDKNDKRKYYLNYIKFFWFHSIWFIVIHINLLYSSKHTDSESYNLKYSNKTKKSIKNKNTCLVFL